MLFTLKFVCERHSKIFVLIKPVRCYACILASPYCFDKKFTTHFQLMFTFPKFE